MNEKKRIHVAIDGPNFFYTQKDELGWFADPKKIISWIEKHADGTVTSAVYYDALDAGSVEQTSRSKFLKALPHMGYALSTTPLKTFRDEEGSFQQACITSNMMLDIWKSSDNFDAVLLVSGSRDFEEVVERLCKSGKEVYILSTPDYISSELHAKVGRGFVNLHNIKPDIAK